MYDLLNRRMRRLRETGEGGFTLIELLVVVVIIGVLIAIAIPLYLNYQRGSNDKAAQSDLRNAVAVMEQCNADYSAYPTVSNASPNGGLSNCGAQTQLNLSKGTTIHYNAVANGYVISDTNSGGSKYYCYNSTKGGSVAALASAPSGGLADGLC